MSLRFADAVSPRGGLPKASALGLMPMGSWPGLDWGATWGLAWNRYNAKRAARLPHACGFCLLPTAFRLLPAAPQDATNFGAVFLRGAEPDAGDSKHLAGGAGAKVHQSVQSTVG